MAAKRYSKKREAILACLSSTKSHPSAEWVYQQLKPEFPDLSLATLYRNLSAFRHDGEIMSVGVVKGHERFDATTASHTHFVCTACGRVDDLEEIILPEDVTRKAAESRGIRVERCQLTLEGLCRDCQTQENTQVS